MCGISGCVGSQKGIRDTMDCLGMLEYRGYDSSGIAYFENGRIKVIRAVGKLNNLSRKIKSDTEQNAVIGHTRWATHGKPTIYNAHPHTDERHTVALVHNGIIDNFEVVKAGLIRAGIKFCSQTDTEVLAQWLGKELNKHTTISEKNVFDAIRGLFSKFKGTFAIAFLVRGLSNRIFFAKQKSPLIIGQGKEESYLASDTNALVGKCQRVCYVGDGEYGCIGQQSASLFSANGQPKNVDFVLLNTKIDSVKLCSYNSYLQKEIDEGAFAAIKTIKNCSHEIDKILKSDTFENGRDIHIVACGTALHAGRVIKYLIEHELRMPVSLDYASEFKYKRPIIGKNSICFFISQSGETADTLGCVELAKTLGATTIGVTNVPSSRIAQTVDFCLFTYAGAEISVASTKAYLAQLGLGYALVQFLAKILDKKVHFCTQDVINVLVRNKNRKYYKKQESFIGTVSNQKSIFFIGRGLDYFVAMEGALKLKEVCYIHCEALAAGELKHGSLALVDKNSIVIAVLTQEHLIDKMLNNIHELNSRGAKVILYSPFAQLKREVYGFVKLPKTPSLLSPLIAIKPLQELTLYVANKKGIDPDKPRNLAKSVTVE